MADEKDIWSSPAGDSGTPRGFTPPPLPPPPLAGQAPPPSPHVPLAPGQVPPPGTAPYTMPPVAYNPYPKNWMGIVALIAPFAGCVVPGGTIAGIVFGHLSLNACNRGEANNRGLGLAGLIVSYAFTGIAVLWFGLVMLSSAYTGY